MIIFFRRVRSAFGCWSAGLKVLLGLPIDRLAETEWVLDDVLSERMQQLRKWGEQSLPNNTGPKEFIPGGDTYAETLESVRSINDVYNNPAWDVVLLEEVLEALVEKKPRNLRRELIQVAAVAVSWIEALDRRGRS